MHLSVGGISRGVYPHLTYCPHQPLYRRLQQVYAHSSVLRLSNVSMPCSLVLQTEDTLFHRQTPCAD